MRREKSDKALHALADLTLSPGGQPAAADLALHRAHIHLTQVVDELNIEGEIAVESRPCGVRVRAAMPRCAKAHGGNRGPQTLGLGFACRVQRDIPPSLQASLTVSIRLAMAHEMKGYCGQHLVRLDG